MHGASFVVRGKRRRRHTLLRAAALGAAVAALWCGTWLFLEWRGPHSSRTDFAVAGTAVLAFVTGIAGVVGAGFARTRRLAVRGIAAAAGAFAVTAVGGYVVAPARDAAFVRFAARAEELVGAIAAYEREHGAPPPSLHALVPRFLSAVPDTGMPAYAAFEYAARGTAGRGFELRVSCTRSLDSEDSALVYREHDGCWTFSR